MHVHSVFRIGIRHRSVHVFVARYHRGKVFECLAAAYDLVGHKVEHTML